MADLLAVAAFIAFFAIAALFVVACDHIIGAEETETTGTREASEFKEAA
jgi:hypothetical protein